MMLIAKIISLWANGITGVYIRQLTESYSTKTFLRHFASDLKT